jgi:hypothetical protein
MEIDRETVWAGELGGFSEALVKSSSWFREVAPKPPVGENLASPLEVSAPDKEIQICERPPRCVRVNGLGKRRALKEDHLDAFFLEDRGKSNQMPLKCEDLEHGISVAFQDLLCLPRRESERARFRSGDRKTGKTLVVQRRNEGRPDLLGDGRCRVMAIVVQAEGRNSPRQTVPV